MEMQLMRTEHGVVLYRYMGRGRVFKSLCHVWEIWCERPDGQLTTTSSCFPVKYGFHRSVCEARRDATQFLRVDVHT